MFDWLGEERLKCGGGVLRMSKRLGLATLEERTGIECWELRTSRSGECGVVKAEEETGGDVGVVQGVVKSAVGVGFARGERGTLAIFWIDE